MATAQVSTELTARAVNIAGTEIPDWMAGLGALILLIAVLKIILPGKSGEKKRKTKRDRELAAIYERRNEEYKHLTEAMQPLIQLQEDLNGRLKRLMERELKTATQELKRERLESDLKQFETTPYSKLNSWHLKVEGRDGHIPVVRIRNTGTHYGSSGVLGAVDHEDTENWERTFRYVFRNTPGSDHENLHSYAFLTLEDAKRLIEQSFIYCVSELPFGFTPDMLGLTEGPSPEQIIRSNPATGHSTSHFAR